MMNIWFPPQYVNQQFARFSPPVSVMYRNYFAMQGDAIITAMTALIGI